MGHGEGEQGNTMIQQIITTLTIHTILTILFIIQIMIKPYNNDADHNTNATTTTNDNNNNNNATTTTTNDNTKTAIINNNNKENKIDVGALVQKGPDFAVSEDLVLMHR